MDAGRYRCGVRGFPDTFEDGKVTVSDFKYLIGMTTAPFLPKSSIKPTVWSSSSPSTPIVSENDAETISNSSNSWRTSYTLAAVLSVLVFVVISMTLLVYHLKTRKKSTDESEICGSLTPPWSRMASSTLWCTSSPTRIHLKSMPICQYTTQKTQMLLQSKYRKV
ncbi:hypothetical protein QQF64_032200 [Cirrhinus molitorella]|uniref:Uncharacterized protein n=1 Tax=Cirrhinus molitorella TaxID=172907 RepID=A0ABR3MZC3_9TELE